MSAENSKQVSTLKVIIAFATVYIVWGSTYFFIRVAIEDFPPMLMAAFRFITAGVLMLLWCIITKEKVFDWKYIKPAAVSGLLMLFIGNGAVIWAEQYISSSLAAILVSASPLWFIIIDKPKWSENFNRQTIFGLVIGFIGVILLFSENLSHAFSDSGNGYYAIATIALVLGSISWAAGSIYSKYKASGSSNTVNTTWQIMAAGLAFVLSSFIANEPASFHFADVSMRSWMAVIYLITMGSLAGYSAYVWLLKVRPAAQVSTYAYVNPVVAVLLGVFFGGEHMTMIQISGLAIILVSVLLINLAKARAEKRITLQKSLEQKMAVR